MVANNYLPPNSCVFRHRFFDYASAGPYCKMDMNPVHDRYARSAVQVDAMFLSPHKFIGGVGTPGVLVAKKKLFENALPPHTPGGPSCVT